MSTQVWVYFKDSDVWFEIKERYVKNFKSHKMAASNCGVPFHTFRRIGKTSNWIPKKSLDIILKKTKIDYESIKDNIEVFVDGQKELKYHLQATKKKKEIFGKDYFKNLSLKKWENTPLRERRAHSKKMCIKTMKEEKIRDIIFTISTKCNINKKFLEYCFNAYRNGGTIDIVELVESEDEKRILKAIDREIKYTELIQKTGKDPKKANEILHSLYDKGFISIKIPYTDNIALKQENIKCSINRERIKFLLKKICQKNAEKLMKLVNEIEDGYFICEKDNYILSFEEIFKLDYKCPKCSSNLLWKPDTELSVTLEATALIFRKVNSMADA